MVYILHFYFCVLSQERRHQAGVNVVVLHVGQFKKKKQNNKNKMRTMEQVFFLGEILCESGDESVQ